MLQLRGVNGPVLGKFRLAALTGLTTGITGGGEIFAFRFNPSNTNYRALITDFRIKAQVVASFTAANELTAQAFIARTWTAADTGGTSATLSGLNNDMSSVDTAYLTQATINTSTTGALAAGTRTLDAQPFLVLPAAQVGSAATAQAYFETALPPMTDQQFPPNLSLQEGIVVTIPVAQGAGGTVRYCVEIGWIEYATNSAGAYGG